MKPQIPMVFGRYDVAVFVTFIAYAAGSVVVPVALVLIARDLNFRLESGGMAAGGALHLGRTISMVVTMLLCGYLAGRWGKRRILGAAVVVMGMGMAFCAFSPVYGLLLLALAFAGLGEGVIEGLITPFVQDLHRDEPGRYINFSHGFWCIGVVITVVVSGALLAHHVAWRLVIAVVAIISVIPAALLLLPEDPARKYPEHPETIDRAKVTAHARQIVSTPRFWLYYAAMFVAGGGEFCLTFWTASYIQLNFSSTAWIGGLGTALFSAGMFAGRTWWGYALKQQHLKRLIVWSAVAGAGITLLLPGQRHLAPFMAILFVAGLAVAPYWPSVQSLSADRLPHVDTTMLFILLACAGVPGCGVATWLMGWIGNHNAGLNHAFYLVPGCFLLLAIIISADRSNTALKRSFL